MRAVGYKRSLPIDQIEALIDLQIDKPAPQKRDLLVQHACGIHHHGDRLPVVAEHADLQGPRDVQG